MATHKDDFKLRGRLRIVLTGEDGKVKDEREINNLVVTIGKDFVTSRMIGTAKAVMSHIGVGTSSTAAATGQTDLQTPLVRSNTSFSANQSTSGGGTTNDTVTYTATFPAGTGTGALTEAGIFNAASAGDMLARTVFSVINKGAGDALTITWKVTAA